MQRIGLIDARDLFRNQKTALEFFQRFPEIGFLVGCDEDREPICIMIRRGDEHLSTIEKLRQQTPKAFSIVIDEYSGTLKFKESKKFFREKQGIHVIHSNRRNASCYIYIAVPRLADFGFDPNLSSYEQVYIDNLKTTDPNLAWIDKNVKAFESVSGGSCNQFPYGAGTVVTVTNPEDAEAIRIIFQAATEAVLPVQDYIQRFETGLH